MIRTSAMKDLNWYLLTEAAVQNNSFSGKLRKVAENNLSLISCHWPAGQQLFCSTSLNYFLSTVIVLKYLVCFPICKASTKCLGLFINAKGVRMTLMMIMRMGWIYLLCAIWYHLYNLQNVKNTHEGL